MTDDGYSLGRKRVRQLEEVDMLPGPLRAVVHDYGYPVVKAFMSAGVKDPRVIRNLIKEIWMGERQLGQRGGAADATDFLLSKRIVSLNALVAFLAANNLAIVPISPTREMIDASMNQVTGHSVLCTKEEKHRRRLRAAILASPYFKGSK